MIEPEQHDGPLPEHVARPVEHLAALATAADGVAPLDEDAVLGLRLAHRPPRLHLLTRSGTGEPSGYAQVTPTTGSIALVVAPGHRRQQLGSALLAGATRALAPGVTPSGWAHGDLPPAVGFAGRHGFTPTRTLLQLRRSLDEPVAVRLSPGYRLRAFVPGQDDAAWLALNASAFVAHPEQGRLAQPDLDARMAEPWFDPAGLLLAEAEDGSLAAFHWTKVHPSTEDDPSPSGEVYVLGVDPARQGHGLGRAILAAGLEHLRAQGLHRVLLYVDADNTPAVRVYRALGFSTWRTDTRYAQ